MNLHDMMMAVYRVNVDNGWFEEGRSFGDEIALLHSEVSEALEEYRDRGMEEYLKLPDGRYVILHEYHTDDYYRQFDGVALKPIGVPSEAADILIRLLDFCYRHDIDLEAEFTKKMAYNATRGYKHGGKKL